MAGPRGDPVRYGPTGQSTLLYAEFVGLKETQSKLSRARGQFVVKTTKVGEQIGKLVVGEIVREAPRGRSGKLGRNIYYRLSPAPNGFALEAISGMYYSGWVIGGRGPVYAKYRKALRFQLKSGEVLYRKSVGPAKANPFHERGWRRAEPKVYQKWGDGLTEIVSVLEE